jgi:hypothetical protein
MQCAPGDGRQVVAVTGAQHEPEQLTSGAVPFVASTASPCFRAITFRLAWVRTGIVLDTSQSIAMCDRATGRRCARRALKDKAALHGFPAVLRLCPRTAVR